MVACRESFGRRYLADQDGMRRIGAAVAALAADPIPWKRSTEVSTTACALAETWWCTWWTVT
jgi:hypothetical protein